MDCYRDVDEIAESIRQAKERGCPFSLLIGAGCSVKAGIPTADEFVRAIQEEFPLKYARAEEKTYACCMEQLHLDERNDLVRRYLEKAKINWAHIGIAALMHHGYVSRVLTTNFDSLIVQACALLGVFPAVYDFAASQLLKPKYIPLGAVFHLHGQGTGFVLLHTGKETKAQSKRLGRLFQDAGSGHGWIVVGYSGRNDPVFNLLAKTKQFDAGLYWVGYQDNDLGAHVRERLLVKKGAHYTNGEECDADWFFINLCLKLRIFPPDFIGKPFTHLDCLLERLTPFPLVGEMEGDITRAPRSWIREAITTYENSGVEEAYAAHDKGVESAERSFTPDPTSILLAAAERLMMKADFQSTVDLVEKYMPEPTGDLAYLVSRAYFGLGWLLHKEAEKREGEESFHFLEAAGQKYAAALRIKSNMNRALNNWGIVLGLQAETKSFAEADQLFSLAGEKYEAALQIKPDDHVALCNWGFALYRQAMQKSGEEADRLFALAGEKYAAASQIKPDDHEALSNWVASLLDQSRPHEEKRARPLLERAEQLSQKAEALSPGTGSYNMACIKARLGDEESCREWLKKSREAGECPKRDYVAKDPDFKSVRDRPWFKEFLEKLTF